MTRVRYRTLHGHSDRTRSVRRLDPLPVARKVGLRLAQAMKPVLLRPKRVRSRRSGFSGPEYPLPAPVAGRMLPTRLSGRHSGRLGFGRPGVAGPSKRPKQAMTPRLLAVDIADHGPLNRLRRKGFPRIPSVSRLPDQGRRRCMGPVPMRHGGRVPADLIRGFRPPLLRSGRTDARTHLKDTPRLGRASHSQVGTFDRSDCPMDHTR